MLSQQEQRFLGIIGSQTVVTRPSKVVGDRILSAFLDQIRAQFVVMIRKAIVQRRLALSVLRVDLGAPTQTEFGHLFVVGLTRDV